jgi:hypothetical protein
MPVSALLARDKESEEVRIKLSKKGKSNWAQALLSLLISFAGLNF